MSELTNKYIEDLSKLELERKYTLKELNTRYLESDKRNELFKRLDEIIVEITKIKFKLNIIKRQK